ncbi:MAG: iron-sulfur cluster insertion protein ErpA [Armatimonadaceae bacterium]
MAALVEAPAAPNTGATVDFDSVPITLTPRAVEEVKFHLEQLGETEGNTRLRIYVAGGGCSGLQYGMALDPEQDETDTVIPTLMQTEQDGGIAKEFIPAFECIVDPMSLKYIKGSIVDYVETPMGGGFKVENPNAVRSCGCGSSFSTEEDESGQTLTGGCGSCGSR